MRSRITNAIAIGDRGDECADAAIAVANTTTESSMNAIANAISGVHATRFGGAIASRGRRSRAHRPAPDRGQIARDVSQTIAFDFSRNTH
jgi:hypothetical protein